jgi:hypothetical protein
VGRSAVSQRIARPSSVSNGAASRAPASRLQAKLAVNHPLDAEERDADRIADEVMRGAAPSHDFGSVGSQRPGTHSQLDTSLAVQTAQRAGAPLPAVEKSFFESRFGHDFSAVRVHADRPAAAAARSINARAYTLGDNIVFGAGEYAPTTQPGRRLLAHELTHVVQQGNLVSASGPAIQRKADKQVSNNALVRLQMAKGAMELTKTVLSFGAGNQVKALQASKMNTFYRTKLARNTHYWHVDPSVNDMITADPGAYAAARAYVAKGGNCGEHARIAYEFLKRLAKGQRLNLSSKKGLDHAFVILGDLSSADGTPKEPDTDLAVADAWPTKPTATVWPDHFAYTSKRDDIEVDASTTAGGQSSMLAIAAGIKPNEKGLELLTQVDDDDDVKEKIDNPAPNHFWDHESSAASGKDYTYYTQDAMDRRVDLK